IMELAMYEALYLEDVPMNVAIHEAVKLAQKYEEPVQLGYSSGYQRRYLGVACGW
ncbi:MAG: hypothetical protein IKH15_07445, partial [Bacteroidales bacterium]|nr:hypothetical protein [Bacteroidales bacterium]